MRMLALLIRREFWGSFRLAQKVEWLPIYQVHFAPFMQCFVNNSNCCLLYAENVSVLRCHSKNKQVPYLRKARHLRVE
jgi:hypothetical protein